VAALDASEIAPALGAEVVGIDLEGGLDDAGFEWLRELLYRRGVVCVRDQKLSRDGQIALARRFGELEVHPIANAMEGYPQMLRVSKPAGERAFFGTA